MTLRSIPFSLVCLLAAFGFVAGLRAQTIETLPNAQVGQSYSYQVATSPAAPAGSLYAATGLPTGVSINSSSGLVSGTPSSSGTYSGSFTVTISPNTYTFYYQLTVNPALGTPVITSATSASGTVGQPFTSYTVTASNSPTSFNVGSLPAGLSFSSPQITGTPTAAGTFSVSLSANNSSGAGAAVMLTITISPAGPVPAITSATSDTAPVNAAYSYTITASNSPTAFAASGLPLGLSLNSTSGAITGTPTVGGVYTLGLSASNANGTGATTNLTLTVGALPVVTSTSLNATAGAAANLQLTATNTPLSFNVSGLPTGLTVNSTTGLITGTPSSAGNFTLTVSANNATGAGASASVTLTVAAAGGGGGGGGVSTAPSITSEPSAQTVTAGSAASFTVAVSGTAPFTYQWAFNGIAISGATGATLTLTNVQAANAGNYSVTVTNAGGSIISSSAALSVTSLAVKATIGTQPVSESVSAGGTASFTVTVATGSPPPTYQWQLNGVNIAGATSATLTLTNVQASSAGSYTVTLTNSSGSVTSNAAVLTINGLPTITTQPSSHTILVGGSATFTVAASGATSYQWQFNGTAIAGATGSSYTVNSATAANVGSYAVVVTGPGGSVTSSGAVLAVAATGAPALASQPQAQTMAVGSTVVLSVTTNGTLATVTTNFEPKPDFGIEATGTTYQWYFNGTAIPGATSARYVVSNANASNAGSYSCLVSNASGSTLSASAVIAFTTTSTPGRLVNLSANSTAGPAPGGVLTVGFVVGGSGTSGSESLLIRADGPALGLLGEANTITAPNLSVLNGSTVLASNAGWGTPASNATAVTAADSAVFAFPLSNTASLDAALVTSLPANPGYTVQISNNASATGAVLAELYDDTASYTLTTPRLINISARNQVAAKGNLTAGFSIQGSTSKTVLIRATGPALAAAPFNLSGSMPDPQLALHTSVNGQDTVLATNAGWGGDPQITAVDSAVFAFPLNNPSSADSVLLVTLPPGVYTAVASSVTGTAGIVLVEVYEVP